MNKQTVQDDYTEMVENAIEQEKYLIEQKTKQLRQCFDSEGDSSNSKFPDELVMDSLANNEKEDADLYSEEFRGKFIYDNAANKWFIWHNQYWDKDTRWEALAATGQIVNIYKEKLNGLYALKEQIIEDNKNANVLELENNIKMLERRISSLNTLSRQKSVIELSSIGRNSLGISGDEWDNNSWVIGCPNGVLDLKTGQLRNGKPDDYIKTITKAEWTGLDIPSPAFEQFLKDTFDDKKELIAYIQRLLGSSLVGECIDHVFPILYGQGRNGKTTLIETIRNVLGNYVGPIQAEMLLKQSQSRSSAGPSPDIMKLRGKRLVWASETDLNRQLNIGKIKWLVGGDTLTGRELYGRHEVDFKPMFTLMLLTNHKPHVGADEYALWQRIHLIPFEFSFIDDPKEANERKRDPNLMSKLKTEASGILAWLMRGCLEWQRIGLKPPIEVLVATEEYKSEENILGHFLNDCIIKSIGSKIQAKDLYNSYKQWCMDNGHRVLTSTSFGQKIKKVLKFKSGAIILYLDIKLIDANNN
ncbi:MAG: hypothetical protein HQK91_08555 [Nitrospirae bacterium]|nr:hypothetical protein [Nitrospirota bacterium]